MVGAKPIIQDVEVLGEDGARVLASFSDGTTVVLDVDNPLVVEFKNVDMDKDADTKHSDM